MLTVGIGEYAISDDIEEIIITHALGSCVALIMHSPASKHTALAHIVLPEIGSVERSRLISDKPSYYANVIVPKLIEYFSKYSMNRNDIQIHLVGGADSLYKQDVFHVGARNITMIKDILRDYNLMTYTTDVGGNVSRTVMVSVKDGEVNIKSQKMIL
ncbi:MAG: chemotaxis protein CheD [Lachnotalea sp.]